MEQDVEDNGPNMCATCLSGDRNLICINGLVQVYQMFKLIMFDFAADRLGEPPSEMEQYICWECLNLLKRFGRFKRQVHNAQEHLRILAMSSGQESVDHSFMSQSLSSLERVTKVEYDKIFFNFSATDGWHEQEYLVNDGTLHNVKAERLDVQAARENIHLEPIHTATIEGVQDIVLQNPGSVSHILIREDGTIDENFILEDPQTSRQYMPQSTLIKGETDFITINPIDKMETVILKTKGKDTSEQKSGYTTEYMTEANMLESRESAKLKVQYASAVYKCELCIIGFYNQQQVEDHFVAMHRSKPGMIACRICYVYIDDKKMMSHLDKHYLRFQCKLCNHIDYSSKLMSNHVKSHMGQAVPNSVIKIGDGNTGIKRGRKRKEKALASPPQPCKPGDLRKLLSKKTIEGYQCLECDMFFKNSRARKNHVQRFHREGLQCDHCKKRFVNRTTLATHLRLHEGPLPRAECPVCRKQVRVIQLKYHVQRHRDKGRFECADCRKVFSHLATYQAHLKYSRAHASDDVFKFPCPMCNKGYPTKEQMQDHFNYQHLGKTAHKCPICDKPIASRLNVEKHMMRVHGEKKEKPRNHVCQQCGKAFTDKKALAQHEVIHSGERPLVCDVCHQTFKQKASLYTHKKRVHKIFPTKKIVEFIDTKP